MSAACMRCEARSTTTPASGAATARRAGAWPRRSCELPGRPGTHLLPAIGRTTLWSTHDPGERQASDGQTPEPLSRRR